MSNSRAHRAKRRARASERAQQPQGQSWSKGLAMTSDPSASTVSRWLRSAEEEGLIERTGTKRTGKRGRPPVLRAITEEGRAQAEDLPPAKIMMERLSRQEGLRKRGGRLKGNRRVTQADLTIAVSMMISATGKLIAAGGDSSVLLPEEVDALIKYKCAAWKGDALVLIPAWLKEYNRVPPTSGHAADKAEATATEART